MRRYMEVFHQHCHMQGFSVDKENGYVYWSFTDSVVKTNMESMMILQAHVSGGHLGDIAYYDGKVYSSFMGNSLPGHAWDDWTAFRIHVYDAKDLRLLKEIEVPLCYEMHAMQGKPGDPYGFSGIDGITFGKDENGEIKMFIACALITGEEYDHQMILQMSLEGEYEKTHRFLTGNTVYGIQTLDYDWDTDSFWFTTYGAAAPHQDRETLYNVSLKGGVISRYPYSSPYGLFCLGGGKFLASLHQGKNGNCSGYAYECEEELFQNRKGEHDIKDFIFGEELK